MRRSTAFPSAGRHEDHRRRLSPFRIWMLYAIPWLVIVSAISIYDHHRAIGVFADANFEGSAITHNVAFAVQWLLAAAEYCGKTVAFYGLLPLGIAFVLFVMFLPWAIPWAQGGDHQD